jgi:PCFT/HCP family folate transporter-like MFS transporter 1/3
MYKVHKQDEKRRQLLNRPENFDKIDDTEANAKESEIPVIGNRFGSSRRNSSVKARNVSGIVNNSFISDEEKIIQEAVDIIGDMPCLHLEHCKL